MGQRQKSNYVWKMNYGDVFKMFNAKIYEHVYNSAGMQDGWEQKLRTNYEHFCAVDRNSPVVELHHNPHHNI